MIIDKQILPISELIRADLPWINKLQLLTVLFYTQVYIGSIYPYKGITFRKRGRYPIIILDRTWDTTVLVHELIHALGGNEFSAEVMDAVTGGTAPTENELSTANMEYIMELRRIYQK